MNSCNYVYVQHIFFRLLGYSCIVKLIITDIIITNSTIMIWFWLFVLLKCFVKIYSVYVINLIFFGITCVFPHTNYMHTIDFLSSVVPWEFAYPIILTYLTITVFVCCSTLRRYNSVVFLFFCKFSSSMWLCVFI